MITDKARRVAKKIYDGNSIGILIYLGEVEYIVQRTMDIIKIEEAAAVDRTNETVY